MKDLFIVTAELTELGRVATKEIRSAQDIKDAIGPKQKEFTELKRDAKEKMQARRQEHLDKAKEALKAARELMRTQNLGSFDAWVKSGAVIGLKGKAITKSQAYRLIEGDPHGKKNTKTMENVAPIERAGRFTPEPSDLGVWSGIPKAKVPPAPLPVWERLHIKAHLAGWHGFEDEERAYLLPLYNRPIKRFA